MSRKDVEHLVTQDPVGGYTIMENTNTTGGVVMAVTGVERTKGLPYGGPSDYTPEQLAFVLDKLTGGRSAVYSGDSLTGDLTLVTSRDPSGLGSAILRRIDQRAP